MVTDTVALQNTSKRLKTRVPEIPNLPSSSLDVQMKMTKSSNHWQHCMGEGRVGLMNVTHLVSDISLEYMCY